MVAEPAAVPQHRVQPGERHAGARTGRTDLGHDSALLTISSKVQIFSWLLRYFSPDSPVFFSIFSVCFTSSGRANFKSESLIAFSSYDLGRLDVL